MNKTERMRFAKALAFAMDAGEECAAALEELKAEGCRLTRDPRNGGSYLFADDRAGEAHYLVTSRRGARCAAYPFGDWEAYCAVSRMLCAEGFESNLPMIRANAERIGSDSLRRMAHEAVEQCGGFAGCFDDDGSNNEPLPFEPETPEAPEPEAPKPERVPAESQQQAVFELMLGGLDGVIFEWIGDWVWATGETRANKEELKRCGFRWSAKKTAWYWKPAGAPDKRRRARYSSVDSLRAHWRGEAA